MTLNFTKKNRKAQKPLVSTIIPSYNRANVVGEAIESALVQDWPNQEVIVVDDGSTDDTTAVCRRFGDAIVYIKQPNRGVSSARNRGLQLARGEFVAFLDSDDLWLPGKLSIQMAQMLGDDTLAVSTTHVRYEPARSVGTHYAKTGASWEELFHRETAWATPTIVTRKRLLKSVAGFREDVRHYEDRDFWLRLLFHGRFGCVEEELVVVRRVEGKCLSEQSSGHVDWVKTSINLLDAGRNYLGEETLKKCRSYVFEQLPGMACGSFWHGQASDAKRLGFLQCVYGPKRLSGAKYLILSCVPGLSKYLSRKENQ